jgi:hypothetical protein
VKTCFACNRLLPPQSFYRHPAMADGRLNKCKLCTRKDVNDNREAKAEYYRAYDRERASSPERVAARASYLMTEAGKEAKRRANRFYNATRAR